MEGMAERPGPLKERGRVRCWQKGGGSDAGIGDRGAHLTWGEDSYFFLNVTGNLWNQKSDMNQFSF